MSVITKANTSQLPSWAYAKKPSALKLYQDWTSNGVFNLNNGEKWWRDRYFMLERHGYRLRPRYHPEWTPSWLGTNIIPLFCEDSYVHVVNQIIDAVRISDGTTVVIKQVPTRSNELDIGKYFSLPELRADSSNHCVPIFDNFHDEAEPELDFLVMPLLRPFDEPPFCSVKEVVNFIEQTLRGLLFLHEHDVAHRDCAARNIMMDGSALYPDGFHPVQIDRTPSALHDAVPLRRMDVPSVNYYFIDFGISTRFQDPNQPRLVLGKKGVDQEVPELHWDEVKQYNPFRVDIFILGNLFKKSFVNTYHNMAFLKPLTESMTRNDPEARPTAAEALEHFRSIMAKRSDLSLRWRLRDKSEFFVASFYRDISLSFAELVRNSKKYFERTPK